MLFCTSNFRCVLEATWLTQSNCWVFSILAFCWPTSKRSSPLVFCRPVSSQLKDKFCRTAIILIGHLQSEEPPVFDCLPGLIQVRTAFRRFFWVKAHRTSFRLRALHWFIWISSSLDFGAIHVLSAVSTTGILSANARSLHDCFHEYCGMVSNLWEVWFIP